MKILYFASIDFFAKPNPSFHLMTTMIEDLITSGNELFFVGCANENLDKHIPEKLEHSENFHYSLIKCPDTKKSNFVKRYFDGLMYANKAGKYIKNYINECDVVFIQSSPTALANIKVVKKMNRKNISIIYNVQDMFPGSSIASGAMKNKMVQRYFYIKQRKAYELSTKIVAISDDMKNKLLEQNVSSDKIEVIVNWFDDQAVYEVPREENLFVKKYNMNKDVFYIQYAGTMGYVFDYKMVLEVAEQLLPYEDIVIQMIGMGSQKDAFVKAAKERNLYNIVFLPLEPQEMVPHVYSACSVCFIPLKRGIIGNSVPSKAGLLMACKRAIVTTSDEGSEYNKMINDNKIGIACSTEDVSSVVDALLLMKNDDLLRTTCAHNGYSYGYQLYSRTENMKKYIKLFESHCN